LDSYTDVLESGGISVGNQDTTQVKWGREGTISLVEIRGKFRGERNGMRFMRT